MAPRHAAEAGVTSNAMAVLAPVLHLIRESLASVTSVPCQLSATLSALESRCRRRRCCRTSICFWTGLYRA